MLCDYLASEQNFLRNFPDAHFVIHAEMPFLWKIDERRCLEGIVDLAFFDSTARRWLILDWKTNKIGNKPEEANALKQGYRLQIAAYWKAVATITCMPVDAMLFSTATGKLLRYVDAELQKAWEMFDNLRPNEQARQLELF